MDTFDQDAAQRVWERVQGKAAQSEADLPGVLLQLHLDAQLLHTLAHDSSGRKAELLNALVRSCREQAQVLQGIHMLRRDRPMVLPAPRRQNRPAQAVLRECCLHLLRRERQYRAMADDREFGAVFAGLRRMAEEDCMKMMQVAAFT